MDLVRDGRSLRYEVSGNGEETIILVPALGTTLEMWRDQLPALEPGYRVVRYNPAGHDSSSLYPEQPSLADYASDLEVLVGEVGAVRPHVVGISMGGMIAQELAIDGRVPLASLTLVSTTATYSSEQREQMRGRAAEAEAEGMESIAAGRLDAWLTQGFRASHPDVCAWVREMVATADPRAYAQAVRAVASLDTVDRLSRISCPTLVVRAELDASTTESAADILRRTLPNARSVEISNASHLCNVQRPRIFNKILVDFVTATGQPAS